jgi:hypothetical protein
MEQRRKDGVAEEVNRQIRRGWRLGAEAHGPGADEILWRNQAGIGYLHYHRDAHGNITALLDFGRNVVERYRYDVFGAPTILSADNTEPAPELRNRMSAEGKESLCPISCWPSCENRI